jgi:hypothetical protein
MDIWWVAGGCPQLHFKGSTTRRLILGLKVCSYKKALAILSAAEIRKEIPDEGGEAGSTSDDFTDFLRAERTRWNALVDESGIPKGRRSADYASFLRRSV